MTRNSMNSLRLAVAGCFGVVAGQAGAVVTIGTPVPFATEVGATATLTNSAGTLDVAIPVTAAVGLVTSSGSPAFLKFALKDGLTFAAPPSANCAGLSGATTILVGGIVGGSSVTFQVAAAAGTALGAAAASAICYVSGGSYTISGATTKSVSAEFEYVAGATPSTITNAGNFISFATGLAAVVSGSQFAVTVDATSGSDNFVGGQGLSAYIGSIRVVPTGVSALRAAGDANIAVSDVGFTTASVTLAGAPIAAGFTSVSGAIRAIAPGASATCDAAAGSAPTSSASTPSITFGDSATAPLALGVGQGFCLQVPGTRQIPLGAISVTLSGLKAGAQVVSLAATPINVVGQNGSNRNAYFVNSSASTAKESILRILNKSGQSGTIFATAYNEAGSVIGTPSTALGTSAPNSMLTFTSSQIETALGFSVAATAKYSVAIFGNLASIEVLNFTRDKTTGAITLSNTSTTDTK